MTVGPLQGLLVIALEQAVAAPYCSSRLADAGARVIKVERPEGDLARHYDQVVHGESAYFVWVNRGKESICLDIKAEDDRALLHKMIARADVFIQNLAPGACARAGFDTDLLRARHPRLITVDISGYGESGPASAMKAYDLLIQCETGLASITGAAAEPGRVGVSVCDIACGMYAHTAVLQALIERGITGQGQAIRVSLFDAIADWMTVPLLHQDYGGQAPARVGLNHPSIAPYGAYRCRDGRQVVLSIQNEREWRAFCAGVLARPELADHPDYCDNHRRCLHRAALDRIIEARFGALDHEQALAGLSAAAIAFASLNSVANFARHPHLRRAVADTPTGPVRLVAPPALFSDEGASGERASDEGASGEHRLGRVPALGEHGPALRREFSA